MDYLCHSLVIGDIKGGNGVIPAVWGGGHAWFGELFVVFISFKNNVAD